MKIADCLPLMSTQFLKRIVESILKDDLPRGDEVRLREQIRQNEKELCSEARIYGILRSSSTDRSQRILADAILTSLLLHQNMALSEESLLDCVRDFEQSVIDQSRDPASFKFSNQRALEIYETVLDVALDDDQVSSDEFKMLERLRLKLGISRREHRLLEAKLGKYPRTHNQIHGLDEFREALRSLQTCGILFYCNWADDGAIIALPAEIAQSVKKAIGFEMRPDAQRLLHDSLTNDQLYSILKTNSLPLSGSKTERSERVLEAGCKPSEILATLKNEELGEMCRKLKGVAIAGSKQDRIDRIVDYYDSLKVKTIDDSSDPRTVWYQYYEELAHRDNQALYAQKLIHHDREMESAFEEATRFLFEVKLGCPLIKMAGSDHADGCVEFQNGELLLWDNKGKESVYEFPKAHIDQFHRYIRESVRRVNVFLVIVPEIGDGAKLQAKRLKHACTTDTDVAIITAENLKWVAENWTKFTKSDRFSLQVFNTTGVLDRVTLEEHLKLIMG